MDRHFCPLKNAGGPLALTLDGQGANLKEELTLTLSLGEQHLSLASTYHSSIFELN